MAQNNELVSQAIALAVTVAMMLGVLWLYGVNLGPRATMGAIFLFGALFFLARQSSDVTVGFLLVTVGLFLWIVDWFVPEFLKEPFTAVVAVVHGLIGIDFGNVNGFHAFVLATTAAFLTVMLSLRLRPGTPKKPKTVVDHTLRRFSRYLETYISIGRLIVGFSFGAVLVALQQSTALFASIGDVVGQAPIVASHIFAIIAGYLSLGGSIPVIGTLPVLNRLTAGGFLFITVLVIALAAGAKWRGRGPLAQFLRE